MPSCKNVFIDCVEVALNDDLTVKQVTQKQLKVIGQNKERLVIDDEYFTTLDRYKSKRGRTQFNQYAGEIRIRDYSKDDYFRRNCGLLVIRVYHFGIRKSIMQNRINKAVNAHVLDKIGAYLMCGKCNIKL